MKLLEEQKKRIKNEWGSWDSVHAEYDNILKERLAELDKEFFDDLNEVVKGATFWYA